MGFQCGFISLDFKICLIHDIIFSSYVLNLGFFSINFLCFGYNFFFLYTCINVSRFTSPWAASMALGAASASDETLNQSNQFHGRLLLLLNDVLKSRTHAFTHAHTYTLATNAHNI